MPDHALHELDVGGGVLHLRKIGGLATPSTRPSCPGAPGWMMAGLPCATGGLAALAGDVGSPAACTTRSHGNNGQEKGGAAE